jgi:hypothetical protein
MAFTITKATKIQSKARIGIIGPAGSGKTYSALAIAVGLGQRIAVIDTENASAAKYAGSFDFDVLALDSFAPRTYVEAIHAIEAANYDVLIIDSLSHAWSGKGGALEMVDAAAKRNQGNSYVGWRDVTPEHNRMVEAMVRCKSHLIVTMRSKTEYVLDKDERTGRTAPRKVGMAPVQRDGLEYEFDIAGDMDLDHNWMITKTRCSALDGMVLNKPGAWVAQQITAWLNDGASPPPAPEPKIATFQPNDTTEAETRFYARYAETINGKDWAAVQRYLTSRAPKPTTIEGWIAAAEAVRDKQKAGNV